MHIYYWVYLRGKAFLWLFHSHLSYWFCYVVVDVTLMGITPVVFQPAVQFDPFIIEKLANPNNIL